MLASQNSRVKSHYRKFNKFDHPDPATIPTLWAELCGLADLAPEGQKGGLHRVRSALLASVPSWDLPRYLDALIEERLA